MNGSSPARRIATITPPHDTSIISAEKDPCVVSGKKGSPCVNLPGHSTISRHTLDDHARVGFNAYTRAQRGEHPSCISHRKQNFTTYQSACLGLYRLFASSLSRSFCVGFRCLFPNDEETQGGRYATIIRIAAHIHQGENAKQIRERN